MSFKPIQDASNIVNENIERIKSLYSYDSLEKRRNKDYTRLVYTDYIKDKRNLSALTASVVKDSQNLIDLFLGNQLSSLKSKCVVSCLNLSAIHLCDNVLSLANDWSNYTYNVQELHISNLSNFCQIDGGINGSTLYYEGKSLYNKNLDIPEGTPKIGNSRFNHKTLSSVYIPSTVKTIGKNSFRYSDVKNIYITNDSLQSIDRDCFERYSSGISTILNITNLSAWCRTNLGNGSSNPIYYYVNFRMGSPNKMLLNGEIIENINVPSEVGYIGSNTFFENVNLKDVYLNEGISAINSQAFCRCYNLSSIYLPSTLKTIGTYAFEDTQALRNIEIPAGIISIGAEAFGCTNNYTPKNITFIGKTIAEVKAMNKYKWNLYSGSVIHCTDGDITI